MKKYAVFYTLQKEIGKYKTKQQNIILQKKERNNLSVLTKLYSALPKEQPLFLPFDNPFLLAHVNPLAL